MKALIKFLILLIIGGLIGLLGFKVLNTSLFNDDSEIPPKAEQTTIPIETPDKDEPKKLSEEEAFESTNSKDEDATQAEMECDDASEIIGEIYDHYLDGYSENQLIDYIENHEKIPSDETNAFINFTKSLLTSPKEQLPSKTEIIKNFRTQCENDE